MPFPASRLSSQHLQVWLSLSSALRRPMRQPGIENRRTSWSISLLKNDPNYGRGHLLKGRLLAADGNMDAALVNIQKAVQADPKSAEAYYALGQLYASRGDRAGAEKAFREVLRMNPRATAAQIQLSRLQLASGNPAGAVQTAEEAARTVPANRDVRLALVRSLVGCERLQESGG